MKKAIDKWLLPYLLRDREMEQCPPKHLVIAICDHFEPFHCSDKNGALARVALWRDKLFQIADCFSDTDGSPPKHSFFYPIEQYDEEVVSAISQICEETGSEGGIHLHHANDNAESLERALVIGRDQLRDHNLIGPDGRYPFIHGNWALDNSHPDGLHCGVSGEISILRKTGCYADFTMPSAPNPTQTRTINSIYYATSTPYPKSHDRGVLVGSDTVQFRKNLEKLLIVQGPLGLNWRWRKLGLFPRIENGDLTGANPPTMNRVGVWSRIAPRLRQRPDVAFVKLHTHGAIESNSATLLGDPNRSFHQALAKSGVHYHYVTAREMVNIIHAFENGETKDPGAYRNYCFPQPGRSESP